MPSGGIEEILRDRVVGSFRLAFHEVTGMCTSVWFTDARGMIAAGEVLLAHPDRAVFQRVGRGSRGWAPT
jgi:hypothetical protein